MDALLAVDAASGPVLVRDADGGSDHASAEAAKRFADPECAGYANAHAHAVRNDLGSAAPLGARECGLDVQQPHGLLEQRRLRRQQQRVVG